MDKYTKVRNIGKGNMGACALARNNDDGKYYVIKQVDLTRMNKKERQQSLNEARVLSSLRHPNIINYVDSFLAKKSDHLCIVMEFADGGDLSSRIKKNYGVNFRESQVLDWFIQLVLSLHYVHQRKILHRDVKTQNVFLTSDSVVKLGDFGIARTLSNTYDQAKTFVGTPYYLSPELILERPYDHRSDVWAVGVVLYELLTLKHPFNATDMKGLMQRILKVQYDPIPMMYSTEMRNIVPRMLMKDPAQRIRLDEVLDLPIVRRRLVEWMRGDVVPDKYLDALLKQKVLPEAVTGTNGSGPSDGAGEHSQPSSLDRNPSGVSRGCSEPADDRVSLPRAPVNSYSVAQHDYNQASRPPSSRKPTEGATSVSGSSGGKCPIGHSPSLTNQYVTQRHTSNDDVVAKANQPSQGRLSGNQSSALYKFYRTPAPLPQQLRAPRLQLPSRAAAPPSARLNPAPTRLSSLDDIYQQLNYYQQGDGGRAGCNYNVANVSSSAYPSTSGAGSGKVPTGGYIPVSARRVNGLRPREPSHAAAYLNPLFRPSNGAGVTPSAKAFDTGNPHMDIKAMLQRAAAERAQRRLGGAT